MPASSVKAEERTSARRVRVPREGPLDPEQGVEAFRRAIARGEPWYPALLAVIARWGAAEEAIDGATYCYLIGGEAFDWLLLAQRLLLEVVDEVPEEETERLLVFGVFPDGSAEEDFEVAIGAPKYRAHLNFQYGVVIEELLLLSVEQEYQKAGHLTGTRRALPDVAAYEHVYGKTLDELQVLYRAETESALGPRVSQQELQTFTYWCSKYRVRTGEPARVASDTRRAVALMSRMEAGRARLGGLRPERMIDLQVQADRPARRPRRRKARADEQSPG